MPMEKNFDATSAEFAIFKKWESAGAFRAGQISHAMKVLRS